MTALADLLQEDTAGDPTGRRGLWTGKRLVQITRELRRWGITVSSRTVRRLLAQLGYALHANSKSLSRSHAQRDRQFQCIARQKRRFVREGLPIIRVDTKKKELIGNFKNAGRVWSREPIAVKDPDFRSEARGLAIPYGIYDLRANRGSVFVGTSHDTPEFAAGNGVRWWRNCGRRDYADASRLLILADSGGSNGARVRAWKYVLQEQLVDRFGLGVTVCHEQDEDGDAWGGINSTYGAVLALFAKAIGSAALASEAQQALNFTLYAIDDRGRPRDLCKSAVAGGWQEDAHTDVIHNYVDALRAFPEWEALASPG